jgi:hypothetical protein
MPYKPPPETVFARVVEARAAGSGWVAVAKLVKRSPHTIRKWPRIYAERWALALRASARLIVDDAANESVLILRKLLDCEDEKIRAEAAWRLIYQRLEQCKIEQKAGGAIAIAPRSDAYNFEQFMKETTHDERMQILASFFRGPMPLSLHVGDTPGARAG